MNAFLQKFIKLFAQIFFRFFNSNRLTRQFLDFFVTESWKNYVTVRHKGHSFRFVTPNSLNYFRANTFATKEPETLEWIESLDSGSILWDIGANVGLYSCYAAKVKDCQVYAFEPSVFNLELLARNIYINELSSKVTIIPLAVSDKMSVNQMNMSSTEWGGALSTFGKNYGHDGLILKKVFEYSTFGLTMDVVVEKLNLSFPNYIKMDVDGIEQLILRGGMKVLQKVKSVSIEINEDFLEQKSNSEKILREVGLNFLHKKHSVLFETGEFKNTYNQVWVR
ncbi:FkbM family methyltransferase [Leptospira sp. 96542]|nr:FkbM family methyltransferase [Leptospira sp. 96542]